MRPGSSFLEKATTLNSQISIDKLISIVYTAGTPGYAKAI
jgi:hypothetical protein